MGDSINRRDFLGMSLGAITTVGVVGSLVAMKKTWDPLPSVVSGGFTTVDISQLKIGELKTFEWRGQPVYVIKKSADVPKVDGRDFELNGEIYSVGLQVCTHLGCIPQYHSEKKQFVCACHGGVFNDSGVNMSGPPPKPMQIPPFNIDGTKLVLGEEGEIYKQLIKA
ncbi:ubiquinol-cytochrome c reductase iron-sulfur subunit [Helicobacter sp. MIT 14-3879]|uniref:ubiquinol-cytochrome c reductase iron-sulfur subunit n=1 Tax=Helicobacter sp. MIT 14-3879 TaxID=2040649 RepID=UPI000E1EF6EA|nr:ubiquinol-cytochrome c reductase iron-sulfur subunit [Helicobacter sp. MIT 14-3879]RDU61637.1 ubiquinol-cytochrome c reductase iron-sulfur subunit [Helicobacter sp. MIT 14-3879]